MNEKSVKKKKSQNRKKNVAAASGRSRMVIPPVEENHPQVPKEEPILSNALEKPTGVEK